MGKCPSKIAQNIARVSSPLEHIIQNTQDFCNVPVGSLGWSRHLSWMFQYSTSPEAHCEEKQTQNS